MVMPGQTAARGARNRPAESLPRSGGCAVAAGIVSAHRAGKPPATAARLHFPALGCLKASMQREAAFRKLEREAPSLRRALPLHLPRCSKIPEPLPEAARQNETAV